MNTSIKLKLRQSEVLDCESSLYLRIIHNRVVRQLATDYKIFPSEWDDKHSSIIIAHHSARTPILLTIRTSVRRDIERLTKIANHLEVDGLTYTTDDIINEFYRYTSEFTLFNFMESVIAKLMQNGKVRTAETYRATLNSFKHFSQNNDIILDTITAETMESYQVWLRNRGLIPNTTSFYMRILRATYNRAVRQGIIDDQKPFGNVYTGIDKTVKRALPLAIIKRIKALELKHKPRLDHARDIFMLSFYLRGMSFIDMAYLKKSDLCNGHVIYRRRKTGQQLTIAWTPEMQAIIDKYPDNTTHYLLPIIRHHTPGPHLNDPTAADRSTYRNTSYIINHHLKRIAAMLGLSIPLTLYVARHSWATAAKAKGIPLSVISEGMGHDSEATTQIYLAGLDATTIDKANALILKSL